MKQLLHRVLHNRLISFDHSRKGSSNGSLVSFSNLLLRMLDNSQMESIPGGTAIFGNGEKVSGGVVQSCEVRLHGGRLIQYF